MVLYYNKKIEDFHPNNKLGEISNRYALPAITSKTYEPIGTRASKDNMLPGDQELFDDFNKTPLSDRKELYYSLIEDNFNNLSVDDKLIVLYKTYIRKTNITNNYILACLAILVIIAIKLYSK